jgi:multicomponent K+:H+ antiporter subunit E
MNAPRTPAGGPAAAPERANAHGAAAPRRDGAAWLSKPSARDGAVHAVDAGQRRWLPHPWLSLLLAAVWLLLNESAQPAQLITAVVLALVVPRLVAPFLGAATRLYRPALVLRFVPLVVYDIVVSNVAVAKIVLNPARTPRPAWLEVPLDATHPLAITLLAAIITMTPGTVSCVVDDERGLILVHALDCDDAATMVAQIKDRYERPLRLILEEGGA